MRLFGRALSLDFVENLHDGIAQGTNCHAGIVGQVQVHAAAAALDKNREVGGGLRACSIPRLSGSTWRSGMSFNSSAETMRNTPLLVPPFLQLARGMQVAGPIRGSLRRRACRRRRGE